MIRFGPDFADGEKVTLQFRRYAAVLEGPVRALSSHPHELPIAGARRARETRAKFAKIEIGALAGISLGA
jgi:hypothetical protein